MPSLCGVEYEAVGGGNVVYNPILASDGCGFGRWEVHPQLVPQPEGDSIALRHNGDWLIVNRKPHRGEIRFFAFKPNSGGRQGAEMMAALYNFDEPTRVVDLCGVQSVSSYTREIVQAKAKAKGQEIPV